MTRITMIAVVMLVAISATVGVFMMTQPPEDSAQAWYPHGCYVWDAGAGRFVWTPCPSIEPTPEHPVDCPIWIPALGRFVWIPCPTVGAVR